ncbi:MAG TPA: disulfide bond formation protein B [Candidatus Absconditabacterales bacterium]|nr:disulfide bond formation protein B [Candidatus Absconditabacterales bacterium]HNG97314.1 disulfide bond formation protein B [Candidatus Absconditabacterales bacterium]
MSNRLYYGFIFIVSLLATVGSLYYGYFGDLILNIKSGDLWNTANALIPCNLCRYIRVFMYPIPVIALIALITGDRSARYYIIRLSLIALVISGYKYGLEHGLISTATDVFICNTSAADCTEAKSNYFGWMSMALLSCVANLMMIGLGLKVKAHTQSSHDTVITNTTPTL